MVNVRYKLFEEEFVESQGMMMTRVFSTLLNRNPEKAAEAVDRFYCLVSTDYHRDLESLRSAKAIFTNKQTVQVGAQTICIGTSCNLAEKKRLIARLFKFLGEDEAQFDILDTKAAAEKGPSPGPKRSSRTSRRGVSYRLFDKKERATQADMLYQVISTVLLQKPELADWAVENLNCVSDIDYTSRENQAGMPSPFHDCRLLVVDGRPLWIATSYGIKQKQHYIDRLLQKAGFHPEDFQVYFDGSIPSLFTWQREMVGAVLSRLHGIGRNGKLLGILSLPSGCGKSVVLGELSRQLLDRGAGWSVLLLTSRSSIAAQYTQRLQELLGGFYRVEAANSRRDLAAKSRLQDIILVSTSQKLLLRKNGEIWPRSSEETPVFSQSAQLLVIVEETSYLGWGQTYVDLRAQFPNAVFLGVTQDPAPSRRQQESFGPLLYRYSWSAALEDGLLRPFEYREIVCEHAPPDVRDRSISLGRIQEIAGWIAWEEQDKSRSSLLICQNLESAAQYYEALLPLMGPARLRIVYTANLPEGQKDRYRHIGAEQAGWDGSDFSGLVIACAPSLVNRPFHTIYLDKRTNRHELLNLCSMLMRTAETRRNNGVLVSFYPIRELLENLLETYIPQAQVPPWSHDSLESFQAAVTEALKRRQYERIDAVLRQMQRFYPEDGARMAAQLGFLFPQYVDEAQRPQYWERRRQKLAWQSDLWCLLSRDSGLEWKGGQSLEPPVPEDAEAVEEGPSVPAAVSSGTSQQRGARLEQAVKGLLKFLFDLENDRPLDTLRVQGSGVQFGFDIFLKYCDRRGTPVTCAIECKNYGAVIQPKDILDKLVIRQMAGDKVDHWILISPHGKISNTLRELTEKWEGTDYWYPILDV